MIKWIILFSFLMSFLASKAGDGGAHGGDPYAAEFVELAYEITQVLREDRYTQILSEHKIDLNEFTQLLGSVPEGGALAYSAEGRYVKLDGQEVDAINYYPSEMRLLLNRTRWRVALLQQKLTLVLHEYFGLMGVELDTYNVSVHFRDVLAEAYKRIMAKMESPVRYYGYAVGSPPLNFVSANLCEENSAHVVQAQAAADKEALGRCLIEKGNGCNKVTSLVETIRDTERIGFIYCEVLTIYR